MIRLLVRGAAMEMGRGKHDQDGLYIILLCNQVPEAFIRMVLCDLIP